MDIFTDLGSSTKTNIRSDDRLLILRVMDDKAPLNTLGLTDRRLFSGENKVHAIMDTHSCLWTIRYEMGAPPPVLAEQRFTSFSKLLTFCKDYFVKRNIEIVEVID